MFQMKQEKFNDIVELVESGQVMYNLQTGEAEIKKQNGNGVKKWSNVGGYPKTMHKGWSVSLHEIIAVAGGLDVVDTFEKLYINHKDGNKLNNSLPNLEVLNNSENNQHAWNIGLKKPAQNKLTIDDVLLIKFLASIGFKKVEIAKAMEISATHISSITTGFRWGKINLNNYLILKKDGYKYNKIEDFIGNIYFMHKGV